MVKIFILFTLTLASVVAMAQQEPEMPTGPNGGYIQNAGSYNVEVIPEKLGAFRVYLLDEELKNPYIRYSNVSGWTENKAQAKSEILCVANKDHFDCGTRDISLRVGTVLVLRTDRKYVRGDEVTYKLPFATQPVEDTPKKKRKRKSKKK